MCSKRRHLVLHLGFVSSCQKKLGTFCQIFPSSSPTAVGIPIWHIWPLGRHTPMRWSSWPPRCTGSRWPISSWGGPRANPRPGAALQSCGFCLHLSNNSAYTLRTKFAFQSNLFGAEVFEVTLLGEGSKRPRFSRCRTVKLLDSKFRVIFPRLGNNNFQIEF